MSDVLFLDEVAMVHVPSYLYLHACPPNGPLFHYLLPIR
jgi:hypothetical protein